MAKKSTSSTTGKGSHELRGIFKPVSEAAQKRIWRIEVDYFESIRSRLFRNPRYRGKFIAVRGREIAGVGVDRFQLSREMDAKFPGEVILIEQAQKEMQKVSLPSVEILR